MTKNPVIAAVLASSLAAGCQSTAPLRYDGVTAGAGNAIAANTVMQMVDPWPAGVENTDLAVPADHDQYRREPPGGESDSDTGTSTTN
jgi:hypothetical protein